MKKPDAIEMHIVKENGEIVWEMFTRLQDQYDYMLDKLIEIPPGEYEIIIKHYNEIKE